MVATAAAAAIFIATFLLTKALFFVAGVVVGSVVGAEPLVVLDTGAGAWLVAVALRGARQLSTACRHPVRGRSPHGER